MAHVNVDGLEWQETVAGDARFSRKNLGLATGAGMLGCSLYELPPGGRDWAYHYHHGNEESIFVLDGEGVLQTPDGERALTKGDYVALRPGKDHAHRVHNRSDAPLRFLCMSTMQEPDVTEYPETGRIGVFCGAAPGGDPEKRVRGSFYLREKSVDYWA